MSVQVLHLSRLVYQAASLAESPQAAPQGLPFTPPQHVQQCSQVAAGMPQQHAQLRPQRAQRLAVNAVGKISDSGSDGARRQFRLALRRTLQRKDVQRQSLPLQLEYFI